MKDTIQVEMFQTLDKTIFESLEKAGFVVESAVDGTYKVQSIRTGAIINPKATERELRSYATCASYVDGLAELKSVAIAFPYLRGREVSNG